MGALEVNQTRLEESLDRMAEIGRDKVTGGITRLALSDEDRQARDLLVQWLKEAHAEVRIDRIGNIFGIRFGTDPSLPPVVAGSHLDTVVNGGKFDGAVGVLGALELLRLLEENHIETRRSYAVACFTNEEGARFQPDMMGSLVLSGKLSLERAYASKDSQGRTVLGELERIGYRGSDSLLPGAYVELHVEQGPVLDLKRIDIGVVEGIQGIAWWYGTFVGQANHAGTTPMNLRKDAMMGAAELACDLRDLALEMGHSTVATMGSLHLEPDVINVVPGKAHFTVDLRQYEEGLFLKGIEEVGARARQVAARNGLELSLRQIVDARPVRFREEMVDLVERSARKLGYPTMRLPSGAGHDAQFMHAICPTAMIFIPSRQGLSHCPEEFTEGEEIRRGVDVLSKVVFELLERD